MWVYPNLLGDEQWSSPGYQRKTQTCNAISVNFKEEHSNINTLTKSDDKAIIMATHLDEAGPSGTRFGKTYLKYYSKVEHNKSIEVSGEPTKLKELYFQKNPKQNSEATSTSFEIDVIA